MGETVTASDDNANENDVVNGVTTFDTPDEKDVGETGDDNADDDDVVIGVATLETTDAEEVGETVSAADGDAEDEDVDNNFAADGTFDDTSDDDDADRDFKK